MKALWFLPFTFAAGAEGFALFAPYLIVVLTVLYFTRTYRAAAAPQLVPVQRRSVKTRPMDVIPDVQPAL